MPDTVPSPNHRPVLSALASLAGRRTWQLGLLLLLSSGCCVALILFRMWRTNSITYVFLLWNLALAWVPMLAAALIAWAEAKQWASPVGKVLLCLIWFFFFPNAPYIVTDFLHLTPRFGVPVWYDLMVIAFCTWSGMALALSSLFLVQWCVQRRFGRLWGWLLVAFVLPSASFGIFIGRFLDWNSWDLVAQPRRLFQDLVALWTVPRYETSAMAISVLLTVLLGLMYGMVHLAIGVTLPVERLSDSS